MAEWRTGDDPGARRSPRGLTGWAYRHTAQHRNNGTANGSTQRYELSRKATRRARNTTRGEGCTISRKSKGEETRNHYSACRLSYRLHRAIDDDDRMRRGRACDWDCFLIICGGTRRLARHLRVRIGGTIKDIPFEFIFTSVLPLPALSNFRSVLLRPLDAFCAFLFFTFHRRCSRSPPPAVALPKRQHHLPSLSSSTLHEGTTSDHPHPPRSSPPLFHRRCAAASCGLRRLWTLLRSAAPPAAHTSN